MNCNIEFKGFEPKQRIRELIEELIQKLERRAKGLSPDVAFWKVLVEENSVRKLYPVSITLKLPGKTLATKEERHDLEASIKDAFAEIERQWKKYRSSLRREQLWKRPARREQLRQKKTNAMQSEQPDSETFFSLVSPHLSKLYQFVRHELARLQAVGDLMLGDLASEDIVDTVLLRAHREFAKDPAYGEIGDRLIQLAREQLETEVKRSKSELDRTVHMEEDIPETPPIEEVSTLGDEILDFYQPDEDLKLEDIFPDVDVSTPEDFVAAKEELLRCVNAALAGMPKEWRRALRLRHAEGLTDEELAEALRKAAPEVERILDYARQHLRQSLIESGCTFIVKGSESRPSKTSG